MMTRAKVHLRQSSHNSDALSGFAPAAVASPDCDNAVLPVQF